ncbi:MAG: hypothetical protein HFJ35_02165 [Clostridia bacterium]|nr:hypothetical protein [Clostridia bacterium]
MKKLMMKLFLGIVVLIAFIGLFSIGVNAATKRKLTKTDIKAVSPISKIYDGDYKHAIIIYKKGVTAKIINRKYKAINGKLTNKKPLNVGKYEEIITIKGTKRYKGKVKVKKKYTIKPRNIQKTDATITLPNNFQYDGNVKAVNVAFNHGMTGKIFISYSGNNLVNGKPIYPGIYKVRVTLQGTGNCKGSVTMDEVYYTIVDARAKNTSVVDNYVARFIATDYSNWAEFMNVVNSVKSETLQYEFEKRISEVTGFHLIPKAVDTNAVDTFTLGKVATDYENWTEFMEVVNSVKAETLQSAFDRRVAEVTGFHLIKKAVDTSAVDNYVATLISTDYTNWTEFMAVVNSVKGETLQSKFDSRVSEVTEFNLTAKTVDTSVVDTFVASKVETDYTNWTEFMEVVNSVKAETLQSKFDSRITEVTDFTLNAKAVDTSVVDTFVSSKVSTDYENWTEFMEVVKSVKAETLQSVFDSRVTEVTDFTFSAKEVDTSVVDTFVSSKVSTEYTNWEDFMEVVNSVKAETLQSVFNKRVTEVTEFELIKKRLIQPTDVSIKFPQNPVYDKNAKEVEVVLKEGITADVEITYEGKNLIDGKPVNAGDYTVKISLKGTGEYGGTLTLGTVQFTVLKAKYDISNIRFEDKTFEYNPLMEYSIYVEGSPVEVTYIGNEQSEKGSHKVIAHFNCDDDNYEAIEDMEAYIIIKESDDIGEGGQPPVGGDDIEEGPQKPPANEDDIIEEEDQKLPAVA